VLLFSPTLRQSQELFKIVLALNARLGSLMPPDAASALRIEFANRSRIISLPGSEETIRGYSGVSLLVIDEAARVEDALYYTVRPMLAVSGGRLIALSTPFGKRGFFFEEWDHGEGWARIRIKADECPRITKAFLAEERLHLGEWWFKQEYLTEFTEASDQIFSHKVVVRALGRRNGPLWEDEL
jgi:hypothetical protein